MFRKRSKKKTSRKSKENAVISACGRCNSDDIMSLFWSYKVYEQR